MGRCAGKVGWGKLPVSPLLKSRMRTGNVSPLWGFGGLPLWALLRNVWYAYCAYLTVLRQGQARSAPDGIGGWGVTGSEALNKCIAEFWKTTWQLQKNCNTEKERSD